MQIDALTTAGTVPVASSAAARALAPASPGTSVATAAREDSPPPSALPAAPWSETDGQQFRSVLTVDNVRDELMTMGVQPDVENIAVAQSLAKLGLPLTVQTMVEAHASLAMAGPGTVPQSFALAKLLQLSPSPGVLRGLSSVMSASSSMASSSGSIFSLLQSVLPSALLQPSSMPLPVDGVTETAEVTAQRNLPVELMQKLGLTVDFNATPAEIATKMQAYSRQVLRSTESRISQALAREGALEEISDLRTLLLRMAGSSADAEVREGAAALASHIEGQQLVNVGAQHAASQGATPNQIAYVALPLVVAGDQAFIEMRLWPEDEERQGSWVDEEAYPVKATIRMTMSQLGRVQANLLGDLHGYLSCRLSAEKPGVLQLLLGNSARLSEMLTAAGWSKNEISSDERADWSPLWTGGEALSKPRKRIDWRA